MPTEKVSQENDGLIRAIGIPGLTANIVNTTIGASIFVLPAAMSKNLGNAAPVAFVVCGLAMAMFVTCFALAGSRVSLTGGLYAYAEVAFGRYVGFLAGLLLFTTNVLSVAAVLNVLVGAIIAIVPALANTTGRVFLMLLVYGVLAAINVRGVRAGTAAVATTTIAKLIPLLVFIAAGVFFIQPGTLAFTAMPGTHAIGDSVLLLLFAFFGIETALVPSGEVRNPSRTVPRSVYLALATTTLIYILIQLVAQGTLGARLAESTMSPLASAAATFLGNFGRLLLLAGATISCLGYVTSDVLSSPRIFYAFGRDGILPRAFAHVHPRFRSPDLAIVVYTLIALAFSLTSTFESLAVMANVAALLLYTVCCAAAWKLMRSDIRTDGEPLSFPGAKLVPVISIAAIAWILSHATLREFVVTAAVLAVGSALYLARTALARPT